MLLEVTDDAGRKLRREFHVVYDEERPLQVGADFVVYANPTDLSKFVAKPLGNAEVLDGSVLATTAKDRT